MVTLATAHPAKFPEAVLATAGEHAGLPPFLGDLMARPERQTVLDNRPETIERFILDSARAVALEA